MGITNTADSFGPTTVKRFKERYPNGIRPAGDEETDNVYGIIQGALWCKGYATHYQRLDTHFDEVVEIAIENLKIDAGLKKVDGVVTLNVMKALLSMDYFVIGAGTDGDTKIRMIQQELNRRYERYIGLMPCDGVYGRNTNKALIYALQAEEGLSVPGSGVGTEANGNFGPTTQKLCLRFFWCSWYWNRRVLCRNMGCSGIVYRLESEWRCRLWGRSFETVRNY